MGSKIKELIGEYRLLSFLVVVVILAVVLVMISMNIYYRSGAYQLDLSRPEYQSVRAQIEPDRKTSDDDFQSMGEINDEVLGDFLKKYQLEAERAIKVDAFSSDVLSDEQLGI